MKEEEKLLFLKAQMGDNDAFEKIFKKNQPLIYYVLNKFGKVNADRFGKDSLSEYEDYCVDALMKSIQTFDVTKDFRFATYAMQCIKNAVLMCQRKWGSKSRIEFASLDYTVIDDITFEEIISDGCYERTCEGEEYSSLYKKLELFMPERVKYIITRLGIDGLNQKELAQELNVAPSYISKILRTYRKKILALKELSHFAFANRFGGILKGYHSQNLVQVYNFFNFGDTPPLDYLKRGINTPVWINLLDKIQYQISKDERDC